MSAEQWRVMGEYFESCNCDVVCPCLISSQPTNTVWPTYTHCDLALAFHIDEGHYGSTDLAGLTAVVMAYTPGPMINKDWSTAYYVDERASLDQREAMTQIFTGKAGGPLADVAATTQYNLGVKFVPIEYVQEGKTRRVVMPGLMDMHIAAKPGVNPELELWHENAHPFAYRIVQAVATESHYKDYRLEFNNSGRNSFYGDFEWWADMKAPKLVRRKRATA